MCDCSFFTCENRFVKWLQKFVYAGKFEGNILVVGRTGCEITSFVQCLAVNNTFDEPEKVEWVSEIALSERRKVQIPFWVSSLVEFCCINSVNDLGNS